MTNVTDYPETLILEPGQTVEGRFARLERGHTKSGEARAIAIIVVDGDERSLWLHETALRGQFREKRPQEGELIRVSKGAEKATSADGFGYWPCKVLTPERDESVSWDDPLLAGEDERGGVDDDALPF